jgi:hypothetical protein
MKKIFYTKIALVSLMAMALFSACLKDDSRYIDFAADPPVVDFPILTVSKTGALNTATISAAAATNIINAEISVGAPKDMTTATAVTVVVDAAALTTYNTANKTAYLLLPASTYTVLGSLTVNIFPGIQERIAPTEPIVGKPAVLPTSLGAVSFTVTTAAVQALPAGTYVLPLTITSAVGNGAVIDQWHTLYYKIVVGP